MNNGMKAMTFVAAMILGLSASRAIADVNIQGDVSGRWTLANSPYLIIGNTTVPQGQTLVIDPGVEVIVMNRYHWDIRGTLTAVGSGQDSIKIFSTVGLKDSWFGIKFFGAAASSSRLERTVVRHAFRGIECDASSPSFVNSRISDHEHAGIRLSSSSPLISGCVINNITDNGIAIISGSNPAIRNSDIFDVGGYGVGVATTSLPVIEDCRISRTGNSAINLDHTGGIAVRRNYIKEAGQRGISLDTAPNCTIEGNIVFRASGPGVYVYRSDNATLLGNTFYECEGAGVQIYSSSSELNSNIMAFNSNYGISVQSAEPVLQYNDVFNNGGGEYQGVEADFTDISENPFLADPAGGDFHPIEDSPVVDMGDPRLDDADGTRRDIGALFFNQNHPPEVITFSPQNPDTLAGDVEIVFSVEAVDPDDNAISYLWFVNGRAVAGQGVSFRHTFEQDGAYSVVVVMDDRLYLGKTELEWNFVISGAAVEWDRNGMSLGFELSAPYPNPFNSSFSFDLINVVAGDADIFLSDLGGRRVSEILSGRLETGVRRFSFDGGGLAEGVYILTARRGGSVQHRPVVFVK